jgi:hypothetical protein
MSGHSTAVEINAANHSVSFEKEQTLTTTEGDWGWTSKPVTISKVDLSRLGKPDEKARHIKDITEAAVEGMKQRVTASGDGRRVMYSQERPAYLAKNRYNLPEEVGFSWPEFVAARKEARK